jgi:ATP-dependent RNA helicase DDX35
LEAKLFESFFKEDDDAQNTNTSSNISTTRLEDVGILSVEGKQFPVHIQYLSQPSPNFIQTAIETIFHIHKREPLQRGGGGDILVFLPGRESVDNVVEAVNDENISSLYAVPMYGGLTLDEQLKAVERPPPGVRKVVVGKESDGY